MKAQIVLTWILVPAVCTLEIEYFNSNNLTTLEIQRQYTLLHKQTIKIDQSEKITNLNAYLQPFHECLIHLINYQGVNIVPLQVPTVLTRYKTVKVSHVVADTIIAPNIHSFLVSHRNRIYPFEKVPRNKSIPIPWCSRHSMDLECHDIPYIDKSTELKSWACEAHLYLLPPKDPINYQYDFKISGYGLLIPGSFRRLFWKFQVNWRIERQTFAQSYLAVTRKRYDILVSEPNQFLKEAWLSPLVKHAVRWIDISSPSSQELLIFNIKPFHVTNLYIYSAYLLCRHCSKTTFLNQVPLQGLTTAAKLSKQIHFYNKDPDNIIYKIWTLGGSFGGSFSLMSTPFPVHRDLKYVRLMMAETSWSLEDLRWNVEAHLFRDIFGNASFTIWPFSACKEELEARESTNCEDSFQPLVIVRPVGEEEYGDFYFHRQVLTFVSCGTPQKTALAFDQLISVFDHWIWLGVLLMICAGACFNTFAHVVGDFSTSITFNQNWCHISIENLLNQLKALVDQGNPFNMDIIKCRGVRYNGILYLLVALVISNAYKYENITNLTLPRKPIPYDTFDSLVNNSFTIYTRAVIIGGLSSNWAKGIPIVKDFMTAIKSLSIWTQQYGKADTKSISFHYKSEIFAVSQAEIAAMDEVPYSRFKTMSKHYVNHSTLHPHWYDLIYDEGENCSIFSAKGRENRCDVLKCVNKTALLLTQTDANVKYHELKGNGYDHAYIGKTGLGEIHYGLLLTRWAHVTVLQRLKGMDASGIMGWWDKIVLNLLARLRVQNVLNKVAREHHYGDHKPSNLNGNIAVVFTLLPVGMVISAIIFILEKLRVAWQFGICMAKQSVVVTELSW